MSSPLERLFRETKRTQQADPFLLSGLDPSLIHDLRDNETIRSVVDSVIRAQWLQIHPDRAPSSAEKQRREQAKGELESALQQLKSAEFAPCLQRFRKSFPEREVESPADLMTSFSRQFEPLDSLLLRGELFLPLSSLRDVTVELFDLPVLAKELNRLCKKSLSANTKTLGLEILRQTPETVTLAGLVELKLGHKSRFFDECELGRELHKRVFNSLQNSENEDLKLLRFAFKATAASDEELAMYEERGDRCFANVKDQIVSIWNAAVESLATSKAFDGFVSEYADILRHLVVERQIAEMQTFARSLPIRKLYIDPSGRFSVDGETGSLHCAPLIDNKMVRPDSLLTDSDDDDDDLSAKPYLPDAKNSLVDLLIRAALEHRENCPTSHPIYRPESATILSSKSHRLTARAHNTPYSDTKIRKTRASQVADAGFSFPGTGLAPQDFFYNSELGYPPALPSSLLTQAPQGHITDNVTLYLLVSHRSRANSTSSFYLEGFVHRIYRGH